MLLYTILPIADKIESVAATVCATVYDVVKLVRAFPVTVVADIAVRVWVPVTSPDKLPVKFVVLPALVAEPLRVPENAGAVTVPVKVGLSNTAMVFLVTVPELFVI